MLNVEEDENRIKMTQERLMESEKRNQSIMSEIGNLRDEVDELRKNNNKL